MNNKEIKKDQIYYLLNVKSQLLSREMKNPTQSLPKSEVAVDNNENLLSKLDELTQKVEGLEVIMQSESKESIRKTKVKDQIISVLQEHRKLNSSQLSGIIGLSRTRCNEYLKELSTEGLTEGVIAGRQKFYKLVR